MNIKDEQDLCVSCGFCCDKTLFDVASLSKNEETHGFFAENEIEIKGDRYFKLPCAYFDSKCTIYDQRKPKVCSAFKCELLKTLIKGEILKEDALRIVQEVKAYRLEIINDYKNLIGETLPFREICKIVLKEGQFEDTPEKRKIKFKTQLMDIQLAKEFKSKHEFNEFYAMID